MKILKKLASIFGAKSEELPDEDRAAQLNITIARREADAIIAKETAYVEGLQNKSNELVSTIIFEVVPTTEEAEYFKEGTVPWISIENRNVERNRLIDADAIVIDQASIMTMFDYPLDNPTEVMLHSNDSGFSRWQLIDSIGRIYEEIYAEEEETAATKTLSPDQRKIMNRNQTDGRYGIWGHDLADLAISSAEIRKNSNGECVLWLRMES